MPTKKAKNATKANFFPIEGDVELDASNQDSSPASSTGIASPNTTLQSEVAVAESVHNLDVIQSLTWSEMTSPQRLMETSRQFKMSREMCGTSPVAWMRQRIVLARSRTQLTQREARLKRWLNEWLSSQTSLTSLKTTRGDPTSGWLTCPKKWKIMTQLLSSRSGYLKHWDRQRLIHHQSSKEHTDSRSDTVWSNLLTESPYY